MRCPVPFVLLLACIAVTATCVGVPDGHAAGAGSGGRGADLYLRHCAICHGAEGDADPIVADLLLPRPRAFRAGLFKLVRTQNGVPAEQDLVHTLQNGMPGSTMMAWDWLPKADLQLLAQHVRELAVRGRAASIRETAAVAGLGIEEALAMAAAEREFAPGPAIDPGTPVEPTAAVLAAGEKLFGLHCAACHGPDGRGLPAVRQWSSAAELLAPRDFTAGYLRGGDSHAELSWRIRAGMPGAHMPPTLLSPEETAALLAFVKSMIPEGAADRHRQWRRTIRAGRVAALPAAGDAAAWQSIEAVRLPLAPLYWRPEAATEAWVRIVHDGREIALQLRWQDATRNDRALAAGGAMGDGVAVQFSRDRDPPLFAMGSTAQPVNVWRWQAFDPRETAGIVDLLVSPLHEGLDVPMAGFRPRPRSESIALGGIRTVGARAGNGLPLAVDTSYADGSWTATFRRPLAARDRSEIDLQTQGPVLFAIAVWNGAIDAHAGSKAITTWHALEL